MATNQTSNFLRLPKELRLQIYQDAFEEYTTRPQHFDTYMLPLEWPRYKFCTIMAQYAALLLISKETIAEVKDYVPNKILPKVMVYFDDAACLHSFYKQIVERAEHPCLGRVQICLYSLCYEWLQIFAPEPETCDHEDVLAVEDVAYEIETLCRRQPGYRLQQLEPRVALCSKFRDHGASSQYMQSCMSHGVRGRLKLDHLLQTSPGSTATISLHQVCGESYSAYVRMVVSAKNIEWHGWRESRYSAKGRGSGRLHATFGPGYPEAFAVYQQQMLESWSHASTS